MSAVVASFARATQAAKTGGVKATAQWGTTRNHRNPAEKDTRSPITLTTVSPSYSLNEVKVVLSHRMPSSEFSNSSHMTWLAMLTAYQCDQPDTSPASQTGDAGEKNSAKREPNRRWYIDHQSTKAVSSSAAGHPSSFSR